MRKESRRSSKSESRLLTVSTAALRKQQHLSKRDRAVPVMSAGDECWWKLQIRSFFVVYVVEELTELGPSNGSTALPALAAGTGVVGGKQAAGSRWPRPPPRLLVRAPNGITSTDGAAGTDIEIATGRTILTTTRPRLTAQTPETGRDDNPHPLLTDCLASQPSTARDDVASRLPRQAVPGCDRGRGRQLLPGNQLEGWVLMVAPTTRIPSRGCS